jgi:RNA polymerase sigma factor for flagellar operon FliA
MHGFHNAAPPAESSARATRPLISGSGFRKQRVRSALARRSADLHASEARMELTTELPKDRRENGSAPGKQALWRVYWKSPSDQRRNRLVEAYLPLVREVVQRIAQRLPRTVDHGDLEAAANVGLIAAITSFDPSRGVRFEVYARTRIRGALIDELRKQDWVPRHLRVRLESQKRTLERLRAELDREPFDEEMALAMEISFEEYELFFGTALPGAPGGSMPESEGSDEPGFGLEVVADTRADQPGEELTRAELLRLAAQRMSELEYRIVYLRYWEDLKMREIGELVNLSESRVYKIHEKLLARLQDRFRARASLV